MKRTLILLLTLLLLAAITVTVGADTDLRSELFTLLSKNYNQSFYTIPTYAVYHAALTDALQVYDAQAATEEQLSEALAKLRQGIDQLQPRLDRSVLGDYAEELNEHLSDPRMEYPAELKEAMISLRDELRLMESDKALTEEGLTAAIDRCNAMTERIYNEKIPIPSFSPYNENEGIVIPEDYMESEETAGKVTELRIRLVYLGVVCIPVGLIVMIVYLATGRNQKNAVTPTEE